MSKTNLIAHQCNICGLFNVIENGIDAIRCAECDSMMTPKGNAVIRIRKDNN